jgi:hypothetical protein
MEMMRWIEPGGGQGAVNVVSNISPAVIQTALLEYMCTIWLVAC